MSTFETETNSQKGDLDAESSASFETIEEKDVGYPSKRNRQEQTDKSCQKKRKIKRDRL